MTAQVTPVALSIVLPAFNEEDALPDTIQRVARVAAVTPGLHGQVEVIVVSDGSTDATFERAEKAFVQAGGLHGLVVDLVNNVGSHAAIRCGLRQARGQYVAIMASDGQDPPEVLPSMLAAFRPHIDVVWGRRARRVHDDRGRRLAATVYYRVFRLLTGLDYPPAGFDFVVVHRPAVEALLRHRERNSSLFLLLFNLGFGQAQVDYERGARTAGETRWTLRKRLRLAVDMLTGFSAAPIRLVSLLGVIVGFAGILLGLVTLVRGFLGGIPQPGWASLMVVTSLMGGLMLVGLGLLGEYVWRTLDEVRDRPMYLEARSSRIEAGSPSSAGSADPSRADGPVANL